MNFTELLEPFGWEADPTAVGPPPFIGIRPTKAKYKRHYRTIKNLLDLAGWEILPLSFAHTPYYIRPKKI